MTLWTVPGQTSLSGAFSRQEYWSGLPCLPPGDLPDPGMKPASLMSQVAGFFTTRTTCPHRGGKNIFLLSISGGAL